MDLDLSAVEPFRADVRVWLRAHVPAAALPSLETEAGFAAQVKRVFGDPRTKKTVATFYTEWFQLGSFNDFRRNAAFPAAVSDRALKRSGRSLVFLIQPGISPQRTRSGLRPGRFEPGARLGPAVTARMGWVGAML